MAGRKKLTHPLPEACHSRRHLWTFYFVSSPPALLIYNRTWHPDPRQDGYFETYLLRSAQKEVDWVTLPVGGRGALHTVGAWGWRWLGQPGGAVAAGYHREVWLQQLGEYDYSGGCFLSSPGSDGQAASAGLHVAEGWLLDWLWAGCRGTR